MQVVGFDGIYTILFFCLLITAVHCCKYAVSILDSYLDFLVDPQTEGFTLHNAWVCHLVLKLENNFLLFASTALRLFLADLM